MNSIDNKVLTESVYKKNKLLFWISVFTPPILAFFVAVFFFTMPDVHGWQLLFLNLTALVVFGASLVLLSLSLKAVKLKNAKILMKAYGFITDDQLFWIKLLELPADYFSMSSLNKHVQELEMPSEEHLPEDFDHSVPVRQERKSNTIDSNPNE